MLDDVELMETLNYHEITYTTSTNNLRIALLCSKAAILEVCGWIEQAMDLIVQESANRSSLSIARIKSIDENYIRKTYGFSYKGHFEKMMVSVVGYRILETAESQAGIAIPAMEGALTYLTTLRNYYAHTHFNSVNPFPKNMTSIPSPATTRTYARTAIDGLIALEKELVRAGC
jgi:hypothetical protein